jgi:hypothetical protein
MHYLKIFGVFCLSFSCNQEYRIGEKEEQVPIIQADSAYIVDTSTPTSEETADTGTVEELYPMIEITPYDYNFGDVPMGCTEEYELIISSVGTSALIIDELIYINSPDLAMSYDFKLPIVLQPGEEIVVRFEYDEDDLFEDVGKLYIYSNARGKGEQRADHYGQGILAGSQVDVFEHEQINKADILFVVDNSCSMSEEQIDLSDNAEDFVDTLILSGTDFQISVITTDDPEPVTSLITDDTLDAGKVLADAVKVGISGNAFEMGQEMAKKSLDPIGPLGKGFIRDDATLSIVVVSDENDYSPLTDLEYYDFFMSIKDEDLFFFHSVVGTAIYPGCTIEIGERYLDQSHYTGGISLDVCSAWGSSLTTLANQVFIVDTIYPLTKQAVPSTVQVYTGGFIMSEGWYFDEVTNSVYITDKSKVNDQEPLFIMYDYGSECVE